MNKFIIFLFLICISFSGFSQTRKNRKVVKKAVKTTIKSQEKLKPTSTVLITGKITETRQYCGGAPPPQSMLDEYNTPKPVANYKLYIRQNINDISTPAYKEIITDSLGNFTVFLEYGSYSVVDSRKKDKQTYLDLVAKYKKATNVTGSIDENCLKTHFRESDFRIDVMPDSKTVEHNYFRTCNYSGAPCVEFTGPMPQ